MKESKGSFALRALGYVVALFAVMAGLGELLTRVLNHTAPISNEDSVNRSLAAHRTATGNSVTGFFSTLASTMVIIGLLVVAMIVFRLVYRRWRESVFLLLAVGTQTLVFLATAAVIHRARPKVAHLDAAPPTSSFPSGHTGAATALFVGIALVVGWHAGHAWLRAILVVLALAVPIAVAYSRLYRGMHHPSDVAAGLLDGILAVTIWARQVLYGHLPRSWAERLDGHRDVTSSRTLEGSAGVHA
ncbi:MAG: hypothetical protein QOG49_1859 [Frankiaceae bacterium]|nr:hypothetical protein [Frankiaceae bacterium]